VGRDKRTTLAECNSGIKQSGLSDRILARLFDLRSSQTAKLGVSQTMKIKITKVRRQRVLIPAVALRVLCQTCEREVETLTTVQAAEILKVAHPVVLGFIFTGQLHVVESVSRPRICQYSLLARRSKKENDE
jgi:hypothetical protein